MTAANTSLFPPQTVSDRAVSNAEPIREADAVESICRIDASRARSNQPTLSAMWLSEAVNSLPTYLFLAEWNGSHIASRARRAEPSRIHYVCERSLP